jgi:hypothetical protein
VTSTGDEYTAESKLPCPACGEDVRVGTAGPKNLESHRASKACQAAQAASKRKARGGLFEKPKAKADTSLHTFFGKQRTPNPPNVMAPLPVHAPPIYPILQAPPAPSVSIDNHQPANPSPECCAIAKRLLNQLGEKMKQIPETTSLATEDHRLAAFSGYPDSHVDPDLDDWEGVLNPMMKRVFHWGSNLENFEALKGLARRGKHGLDGFIAEYFFMHRSLKGALVKTTFELLIGAIEFECVILPAINLFKTHNCDLITKIPINPCTGRSPKRQ